MAESLAIIDRELGPEPADPAVRAIVRRMIHASADFDFARSLDPSAGSIEAALRALRNGASIVTDVEMLRAGIRRDACIRLGIEVLCGLADPETDALAASEVLTRSAAGLRRIARQAGDGVVVAIGNAPTALDETIRLIDGGPGDPPASSAFRSVSWAWSRRSAGSRNSRSYPTSPASAAKGAPPSRPRCVNALLDLALEPDEGD